MGPKAARLVREWKASFNEANRLDLEEARDRTPSERLRNLQSFLAELPKLGLLRERPDDLEYQPLLELGFSVTWNGPRTSKAVQAWNLAALS